MNSIYDFDKFYEGLGNASVTFSKGRRFGFNYGEVRIEATMEQICVRCNLMRNRQEDPISERDASNLKRRIAILDLTAQGELANKPWHVRLAVWFRQLCGGTFRFNEDYHLNRLYPLPKGTKTAKNIKADILKVLIPPSMDFEFRDVAYTSLKWNIFWETNQDRDAMRRAYDNAEKRLNGVTDVQTQEAITKFGSEFKVKSGSIEKGDYVKLLLKISRTNPYLAGFLINKSETLDEITKIALCSRIKPLNAVIKETFKEYAQTIEKAP